MQVAKKVLSWRRPTLPGPFRPSTISDEWLNFCVRDGNRCTPLSIVTKTKPSFWFRWNVQCNNPKSGLLLLCARVVSSAKHIRNKLWTYSALVYLKNSITY